MTKKEAINFRRNVKQLMATNDVKGPQLAEICGVTRSTISGWLSGKYLPSGIKIVKIAKYFHVSINYLLGKDTTPYEAPAIITTIDEAIDFLNHFNILKGMDVNQKNDEEWINLAVSIHVILKMNGMI
jgi:transcriptional regulator with XRE-family HTH domain